MCKPLGPTDLTALIQFAERILKGRIDTKRLAKLRIPKRESEAVHLAVASILAAAKKTRITYTAQEIHDGLVDGALRLWALSKATPPHLRPPTVNMQHPPFVPGAAC